MRFRTNLAVISVIALAVAACGREPTKKSGNNGIVINNGNNGGGACGNGVLDGGEACDPGIAMGDGACPNTCPSGADVCGTFNLVGSASDCTAACELTPAACQAGDGCCPVGCDSTSDPDCTNTCGDGVVEEPEICDGDCPFDCEDGNACTIDQMTGNPDNCTASCSRSAITSCQDNDGCCATGCTPDTDNDCSLSCGDGVLDDGETCDGNCPTSCDDFDVCTRDVMTGSPSTCNASCANAQITNCAGGDGCCPAGCTAQTDADCSCTPTASCAVQGLECGVTFDGCREVTCGTCGTREACIDNQCESTMGIGEPCTTQGSCSTGVCIEQGYSGWGGGYCTLGCRSDSTCGLAGHCGDQNENGDGVCFLSCQTDADCTRPQYGCRDFDGDGTRECAPLATGNSPVGDPCQVYSDCAGGDKGHCLISDFVLTEGFCTQQCSSDADCPGGSHCSSTIGYCMDPCTSDGQCRSTGYTCHDADDDGRNECWGAATGSTPVGGSCSRRADCAGEEFGFCLDDESGFTDGYCIQVCGAGGVSCPSGSSCESFTDSDLCLATCPNFNECRGGYTCQEVSTGDNVCWP